MSATACVQHTIDACWQSSTPFAPAAITQRAHLGFTGTSSSSLVMAAIILRNIKKMSKYCQALTQALSLYNYGSDVNKVRDWAGSCSSNNKRPVYNVPCPVRTYRKYRSDMKDGKRSAVDYRLQHICRSADYRKAINARTRTRRRLLKLGLISPHEHLHHLNENPMDSRPEHLVALTKGQHERLHKEQRKGKTPHIPKTAFISWRLQHK